MRKVSRIWHEDSGSISHTTGKGMIQIEGIAWQVSWRDQTQWERTLSVLTNLFCSYPMAFNAARSKAMVLRAQFQAIDPFLQKQTMHVCPHCSSVCCIDRHSSFDLYDLLYIFCLDMPIPTYATDRAETDPCQFLTTNGCCMPRHARPFRCTWHFCDTLIAHFQTIPAKTVRQYHDMFRNLQETRYELLQLIEQALLHIKSTSSP
jgi:hypothetical protein